MRGQWSKRISSIFLRWRMSWPLFYQREKGTLLKEIKITKRLLFKNPFAIRLGFEFLHSNKYPFTGFDGEMRSIYRIPQWLISSFVVMFNALMTGNLIFFDVCCNCKTQTSDNILYAKIRGCEFASPGPDQLFFLSDFCRDPRITQTDLGATDFVDNCYLSEMVSPMKIGPLQKTIHPNRL